MKVQKHSAETEIAFIVIRAKRRKNKGYDANLSNDNGMGLEIFIKEFVHEK